MFKQFNEVTSTTLFAIFHQKQTKNENTLLIPKEIRDLPKISIWDFLMPLSYNVFV